MELFISIFRGVCVSVSEQHTKTPKNIHIHTNLIDIDDIP